MKRIDLYPWAFGIGRFWFRRIAQKKAEKRLGQKGQQNFRLKRALLQQSRQNFKGNFRLPRGFLHGQLHKSIPKEGENIQLRLEGLAKLAHCGVEHTRGRLEEQLADVGDVFRVEQVHRADALLQ